MKKNKGITLVALIITIIAMLILVAVSIRLIINSNILETAKSAGESYEGNAGKEANLGEIVVDGITYASIRDWKNNNSKISSGQYEAINGVYVNRPDLTGFNKENTYFVTYNGNGNNEIIGGKINTEESSNWYDYENKIWANIVTASEELTASEKADITTATTKNVAYLVWIPRYEYKIIDIDTSKESDYVTGDTALKKQKSLINFIDTSVTTPTMQGYTIPETFVWKKGTADEIQLSGYWVGKYEVSAGITN